jgi:hypothetical protein
MSAHLQDELLTAALDGTLSAADREVVDAHLEVCAQCREDLELARGAREALRSLPDEIRPPIDVAAAVASELAGGQAPGAGAPSGPPRWYRAAGLVAAAAAIVLGVMILPRVTGDEQQERTNTTEAVGANTGSAPEAGTSAPVGIKATGPDIEDSQTDYDEARLRGLLENLTAAPSATMDASAQLAPPEQQALECLRTAAGASTLDDAVLVRLIDATFDGTPATIGVFSVPDGGRLAVAASRDHCRLIASAFG